MLALLPILVLLVTAALIGLLGLLRPRFVYHWLLAMAGSLAAWVLMWVLVLRLPVSIGAVEGSYLGLAIPSLAFQANQISWPLGLAIVTLNLAVLFTDASRATETSWVVWAGDLGLTAVGMAAVMAGNLGTMLLAWTVVDAIELGILLRQIRQEEMRRRAFMFFAMNLMGTMIVFGAIIAAARTGVRLNLDLIPPGSVVYLILAVGLRMGVFPLQVAFLRDVHHQRGQGTLLRLIPPAVSLSLLAYSAVTEISFEWRQFMLFSAVLASVYGAIVWARAADELRGRLYWIIAVAGLCFASAVQVQQGAVIAWGLMLVYPGAVLFLSSVRNKFMLPIGILSVFTIAALPFSPTYAGLRMYQPIQLLMVILPLAQALVIFGYVRHMLRETEPLSGVEPWVRVVYVSGLAILPVNHIAASLLGPRIPAQGSIPIWPLLAVLGVALAGVVAAWRGWTIPDNVFLQLDKVFSLRWVYTVFGWIYTGIGQLAKEISLLLEGDGGVMWTLLFLVILISILGQVGAGGGVP